jgi:pantoate kinase
MSSPALEEFLARLYTDEPALAEFLRMPSETARAAGLNDAEVSALVGADHIGLVMAAASYCAKRERRKSRRRLSLWRGR